MRISRIQIRNFRNFADVDVRLGGNAVIVGENKIGKSNLLYAIRLVLDPSLPDSMRKLRSEDFWDGLQRPLGKDDRITISIDIADFENNENQLAVLAEHLIEPEPMVARLSYVWQPVPGLEGDPKKEADYEFSLFGGDRPENPFGYEVRRRLPMELMPALRDCEGDLARWSRSPLRPLLDNAASGLDRSELEAISSGVNKATGKLTELTQIKSVADSIVRKLVDMVGSAQSLETVLQFAPTDKDKLIRALRLYIDGGRRGVEDASLGSANLLYLALKNLEYERLVKEDDRDHTFLAIEEPEAHLHPSLQRLIFRNYLKPREKAEEKELSQSSTILMTTHSPHIASVTPLRDFVILRANEDGNAAEAVSTAGIELEDEAVVDLERYIDVNRGELFFARGVILVEGEAEKYLVPALAKNQGFLLDELGIHVCAVSGANFHPYLILLGPNGLKLPVAALTDFDPQKPNKDGTPNEPLGPNRVVKQMLSALVDTSTWEDHDFNQLLKMAPEQGIFINEHTLEVDLLKSGLDKEFAATMDSIGTSEKMKERMRGWATDIASLDVGRLLRDIGSVGKGRFAQRLAGVIAESKSKACPEYIIDGVKYVAGKIRRS